MREERASLEGEGEERQKEKEKEKRRGRERIGETKEKEG